MAIDAGWWEYGGGERPATFGADGEIGLKRSAALVTEDGDGCHKNLRGNIPHRSGVHIVLLTNTTEDNWCGFRK